MAFYLSHTLPAGGWPSAVSPSGNSGEITEVDAEIVRAMWTLFNTPQGSGVSVTPAQFSSVTFSTVAAAGMTSVFEVDAARLPAIPAGYQLVSGLSYQITTTASISGSLVACFNVSWIADATTFGNVRVLQSDGGSLVDRTVLPPASPAPDFATRTVCARTSSLNPFAIAVRDATPPVLSLTVSPATLWPPNGRMVTVTASIDVSDDSGVAPLVELVSITSSDSRRGREDVQNAAFGTDDRQFDLRAAQATGGASVVYTIVYRATDQSGNSVQATAQVRVAHDR
jgi:hypothetical protein